MQMTQEDVLKVLGDRKMSFEEIYSKLDDSKSVVWHNICRLRKFDEIGCEVVPIKKKTKSIGGSTYYKLYFKKR